MRWSPKSLKAPIQIHCFWPELHCNRQNRDHHTCSGVILRPWQRAANASIEISVLEELKMKCHYVSTEKVMSKTGDTSGVKCRTLKIRVLWRQQDTIWGSALNWKLSTFFSLSTDSEGGLELAFTSLIFLQQLNAIVAVEFDSTPVAMVADQQGALLQAALTVSLSGDSKLIDVLGQVLFDCGTLRLWPGALQDAALS